MNVVTSDIDRFWEIWPQIVDVTKEQSAPILDSQYLAKGTPGLRDFLEKRIESAKQLAATISATPKYYASLEKLYELVPAQIAAIEGACDRLVRILPNANLVDAYLLIGRMNSGGTVSDRGILIGFDMFGRSETTPLDELGDWHRSVLYTVDQLPELILHEFAHCNQTSSRPGTLLSQALIEGAADFVVSALMGPIEADRFTFGREHEEELWERFKAQMKSSDQSNWLYEGDTAKDRPADLGYFVGHQICASYFLRQSNPERALQDILSIESHEQFLIESGYEGIDPGELPTVSCG